MDESNQAQREGTGKFGRIEKAINLVKTVAGRITHHDENRISTRQTVSLILNDLYETVYSPKQNHHDETDGEHGRSQYTPDTQASEGSDNSLDVGEYDMVPDDNIRSCGYEGDPIEAEIVKLNYHVETLTPHGRIWGSFVDISYDSMEDIAYLNTIVDELVFEFDKKASIQLEEGSEVKQIEVLDQIDRDLPRTYPSINYFQEDDIVQSLRRILISVAQKYPEIGYVQGMNFVVAFLFLHSKSEGECFKLVDTLLSHDKFKLMHVYGPGLPNLIKYNILLIKILSNVDAELFNYLDEIGLGSLYFVHNWIMTLFAYGMPFDILAKVWDYIFEYGWEGFFRICIALLVIFKSNLMHQDFEQCTTVLREAMLKAPQNLVQVAIELNFSDELKEEICMATCKMDPQQAQEELKNNGI